MQQPHLFVRENTIQKATRKSESYSIMVAYKNTVLVLLAALNVATAFSSIPFSNALQSANRPLSILRAESGSEVSALAPVLDGKRVLPLRVMKAGLKGHTVAAVYALLNSDYKRG